MRLLLILNALLVLVVSQPPPVVHTKCGPVSGAWEQGELAAFRGIPYGAPPVGPLRWQPTQPARCWNGTLQASQDGPVCWQFGNVDPVPPSGQSEDCLLVNVFTKSLPSAGQNSSTTPAPVIVWLHGGSLIWGWASQYTELENLVRLSPVDTPVVVVAVQYRLNAFGFLALDALSQADSRGVSGNYGFLDQQMALMWVQKNIAGFGGDPFRVTLLGQSSGGTSIFALLASAASRGLFHAAISLSGSPNISMSLGTAEAQNQPMVDTLGCDGSAPQDSVMACLLQQSPQQVVNAIPQSWNFAPVGYPESVTGYHYPGLTIVDGVTITVPFMRALDEGLVDVPLVIQSMAQELDLWANLTIASWPIAQYRAYLNQSLAPFGPNAGAIMATAYAELFDTGDSGLVDVTLPTDLGLTCANPQVAMTAAGGFQSPVYLSYVAQGPSTPLIAPSADGLFPILFPSHLWDYIAATNAWNFFAGDGAPVYLPNEDDTALGALLLAAWTELATTGAIASWKSVQSAGPGSYVTNRIDDDTVTPTVNFLSSICASWATIGINVGMWWCN